MVPKGGQVMIVLIIMLGFIVAVDCFILSLYVKSLKEIVKPVGDFKNEMREAAEDYSRTFRYIDGRLNDIDSELIHINETIIELENGYDKKKNSNRANHRNHRDMHVSDTGQGEGIC